MTARYADFTETHFSVDSRSGNEWMVRCIEHDDNNASMRVNVEKGCYYCHSCGAKGSFRSLSSHFGQLAEAEPDLDELRKRIDALDTKHEHQECTVTESTLKRYKHDPSYWLGRGFTTDIIDEFQLGYDPLEGCATIPVRKHTGDLVGIIRRNLVKTYLPRYMMPKGFDRKHLLFGSWRVPTWNTDTVVITEGAVDAMSVIQAGYPAVAMFGSSLSPEQVALLRRLGIWKVTLFTDHDKAGYNARQKAREVLRDFVIYEVRYKRNDPNDPNELGSQLIQERISTARRLL